MECLTQRGNSAALQFPRFALLCSFLGLYRTSGKIHMFQIFRWYSYRAVNRCSGFLRALQSSSIWQPYTKLPSVGVAYASVPCVTKKPSSWEYIFQPFPFPSRLKKYTPTCFSVPLVGLGAWIYLVRFRSAPAGFFGMQSHSCSKFPHRMPPASFTATGQPSARFLARVTNRRAVFQSKRKKNRKKFVSMTKCHTFVWQNVTHHERTNF